VLVDHQTVLLVLENFPKVRFPNLMGPAANALMTILWLYGCVCASFC